MFAANKTTRLHNEALGVTQLQLAALFGQRPDKDRRDAAQHFGARLNSVCCDYSIGPSSTV